MWATVRAGGRELLRCSRILLERVYYADVRLPGRRLARGQCQCRPNPNTARVRRAYSRSAVATTTTRLKADIGEGVGGSLREWQDPSFAAAWTETGQITTNPDRARQVELLTAAAISAARATGATPPTILDLGCGSGLVTRRLVDRGCEVVGIDGSEAMLNLAAAAVPNVKFAKVTFEELGSGEEMAADAATAAVLAKGPFGAITVAQALHEAPDAVVRNVLRWANRPEILAPGGVLLVLDRYELENDGPEAAGVWDALVNALSSNSPGINQVPDWDDYEGRYLAGKGDHVRPLATFEAMLLEEGFTSTMLYQCLNRNLLAVRRKDNPS